MTAWEQACAAECKWCAELMVFDHICTAPTKDQFIEQQAARIRELESEKSTTHRELETELDNLLAHARKVRGRSDVHNIYEVLDWQAAKIRELEVRRPTNLPGTYLYCGNHFYACVRGDEECPTCRQTGLIKELLEALKLVWSMFDDGRIVRNIANDHNPDWALKMLTFTRELQTIQRAIAKAQGREATK